MAWSEKQLEAITIYDKNLLVAAAAGSGKTSVLVERIIRRLLQENDAFQIDRLLVVTFTNAAATEMRERIGSALSKALKERPQSRYLERQLVLLNAASISTLHAFCQSVIRQNFHHLDIDPKFRLANEQEINLLKHDVLEALFEERYRDDDTAFLAFVDHYGDERGDDALYEIILNLYNFSRSQAQPRYWLDTLQHQFSLPEGTDIDATIWSQMVREEVRLSLHECESLEKAMMHDAGRMGLDFYIPLYEEDLVLIGQLLEVIEEPWETMQTAFYKVKFASVRAPKGTDESLKKMMSAKRDKVKELIGGLKDKYFMVTGAEQIEDLIRVQPMMAQICKLTMEFAESFAAAKRSKAIADFNDLEHFCLQVLCDEHAVQGELKASAVAKALQEKYIEVMVDEYQDTNGVQEAILSLVRRQDTPNLFLVGDVKQSIYKFRLAEPELFLQKYRTYEEMGDQYQRILLAHNFRSRAGVLAAINFLFVQLMSPKIAELEYGENEKLNPGRAYPATDKQSLDGPVELHIINRDGIEREQPEINKDENSGEDEAELSGFALEAEFVAARIEKLMTESPYVFDKKTETYRPLVWRDIVILLRSVKNKANVMLEVLRNHDIPSYAAVDSGYFQEIEIQIMLALLHTIDNPRQDIHLASVLHSPIVDVSAAELAQIRLAAPQQDLWQSLLQVQALENGVEFSAEIRRKIQTFMDSMGKWRNLARRKSVPELIWQLFRDTGYYDYVGGMPGGLLRQANLRMLYDRAGQYEATNFRGLFRFLRFVGKMQDTGTDLAVARTLGESENVIRIMSIHKSKGLEFPVVIVADLGKQFNMMDNRAKLLMHKSYGLGPYVTNGEISYKYPSIARQAIAHQMSLENKAEELRVLYVALTRAREKLILVGSAAKFASKAQKWCRYIGQAETLLPEYAIAGASTYLDWICAAVSRHPDGEALLNYADSLDMRLNIEDADSSRWQVQVVDAGEIHSESKQRLQEDAFMQKVRQFALLQEDTPAMQAWVHSVLDWQYVDQTLQEVPAKLSVTEMKRRFDLTQQAENPAESLFREKTIIARPKFIQEKTKLTGAEYGTMMHSVMQHIDYQGDLSEAGIRQQLDNMVLTEKILPGNVEFIDIAGVQKFFQSEIGQRMMKAEKIRRELPFSVMLNAKRFYPQMQDDTESIFVQGIIDVLFDEADGMVLVDYKTDHTHDTAELSKKYELQLSIYAEAIEKILQKKVKEKYLYLFYTGKVVQI